MGYTDWRIGGLSYDVDEDFEQFDNDVLQFTGSDTRSALYQCIVSIELEKLWLNWRILINEGRTWVLYYGVAFRYEDDNFVPIRMNVMSFLIGLLSITILVLEIIISTLLNSYWLKNVIHLSFSTEIEVFPLTFFWRIRPHVIIIDLKTQS